MGEGREGNELNEWFNMISDGRSHGSVLNVVHADDDAGLTYKLIWC